MRRRTKLLLVLGMVVVLGLGVWLFQNGSGPSYQGQTLRQWVDNYFDEYYRRFQPPDPRWVEAMCHFDTNAVPYLLEWIKHDEESRTTAVCNFLNEKLGTFGVSWQMPPDKIGKRASASVEVFRVLGPRAECAIPELARMLQPEVVEEYGEIVAMHALEALVHIGTNGLPAAFDAVIKLPPDNQTYLIYLLSANDVPPAASWLLSQTRNVNTNIAMHAREILKGLPHPLDPGKS